MKRPRSETGPENRTGIMLHPKLLDELLEGNREFIGEGEPTTVGLDKVRFDYAKSAAPVGTMPPAPGVEPALVPFLDKLGARLAFERVGTRLYDGLLSKHLGMGGYPGGPSAEDLVEIREEEAAHFRWLGKIIESLGGDPTAVTPCADLELTASKGVLDVIADPRTSLREGLEAVVLAELADNEGWRTLAALAQTADRQDLLTFIESAEETEAEHLAKLRTWLVAPKVV